MSQRCLVTLKENVKKENDGFYDCIYTEESTCENLLYDWCGYDKETGFWCGPLKICIRNMQIFDKFCEDFKELNKYIRQIKSFDDVWSIYDEQGNQIHISKKEDNHYQALINQMIKDIE